MSLDALAPDQRAVVQLVLQQDRSYDDLASLLGITPEAVRERAHRGLERLAPGDAVDPADRARIADYLLGQQSVSARESTRSLLAGSQPARSWAEAITGDLAGVARSPLPEIPAGDAPAAEPRREPEQTEPTLAGDDDPLLEDPVAPVRARPRPRRRESAPADFGFGEVTGEAAEDEDRAPAARDDAPARTSRLGGALLIAGLAIFVAALIVWLVSRGDDEDPGSSSAATQTPTAEVTPTGTAGTPEFQAIGKLDLRAPDGGDATGRMIVFAAQTGEVAFNLTGRSVPATAEGEAYGVWLVGGQANHFLGFAPPVGDDGRLATSGPREEDADNLANWLSSAERLVVSREIEEGATEPGPVVLEADIAQGGAGAGAAP